MGHPFIFGSADATAAATACTGDWTRPDDWIILPTVDSSMELFYGLAPIYENANNLYAVAINNLAATIDWGDGTTVVSNGSIQTKTYNYTTFSGDIKVDTDGRNYKQARVYIYRTGGAITSVDFYGATTSNYYGGNNFLDINCSFPNATTLNMATDQLSAQKGMQRLERLRIWQRPAAHSANNLVRGMRSLRVLQYPYSRIGTAASFGNGGTQIDNVGDVDYGTASQVNSAWSSSKIRKHGNFTGNSITGLAVNYCANAELLKQFGSITATSANTLDGFFTDCYILSSVKLINAPACTNYTSFAFRNYNLAGLVFQDCSLVTVTTSMVTLCTSLYYLMMPGLTRGINLTGTAIGNYGMDLFVNGGTIEVQGVSYTLGPIGTASGAQTVTVTGTPFGALVTAADATAVGLRDDLVALGYTITN